MQYNGISYQNVAPAKIRENIYLILQRKDYSKEQIVNALKIAQLQDVINNLSEKLDTVVGKEGVKLSGGQHNWTSWSYLCVRRWKISREWLTKRVTRKREWLFCRNGLEVPFRLFSYSI